jgi:hypothetical protein
MVNAKEHPGAVLARIEPTTPGSSPVTAELTEDGVQWQSTVSNLATGAYRIELKTRKAGPNAPPPVYDLFEVVE